MNTLYEGIHFYTSIAYARVKELYQGTLHLTLEPVENVPRDEVYPRLIPTGPPSLTHITLEDTIAWVRCQVSVCVSVFLLLSSVLSPLHSL